MREQVVVLVREVGKRLLIMWNANGFAFVMCYRYWVTQMMIRVVVKPRMIFDVDVLKVFVSMQIPHSLSSSLHVMSF
jgi:hypothetical protein